MILDIGKGIPLVKSIPSVKVTYKFINLFFMGNFHCIKKMELIL